jgi:hypothetical protein
MIDRATQEHPMTEATGVPLTEATQEPREEKTRTSIIYDVTEFYENALAQTLDGERYSTRTEQGIPVSQVCVARDACEHKPHIVVILHDDMELAREVARAGESAIILLADARPDDSGLAREPEDDRIVVASAQMFTHCAPIMVEQSALEMFCYLMSVMYSNTYARDSKLGKDACDFALGLHLRATDACASSAPGSRFAESVAAGQIVRDIIADWRKAMEPAEIVVLGKSIAISSERIVRARALSARLVMLHDAVDSSVRLFECQDMIEQAHRVARLIEHPHADTTITYSVSPPVWDCELVGSGPFAREAIDMILGRDTTSDPADATSTSLHIARATIKQMRAFMRPRSRACPVPEPDEQA